MSDQPAAVPLPRYQPKFVFCCPECCDELTDENWNFWCATCRRSWSFAEVGKFDEGLPDD